MHLSWFYLSLVLFYLKCYRSTDHGDQRWSACVTKLFCFITSHSYSFGCTSNTCKLDSQYYYYFNSFSMIWSNNLNHCGLIVFKCTFWNCICFNVLQQIWSFICSIFINSSSDFNKMPKTYILYIYGYAFFTWNLDILVGLDIHSGDSLLCREYQP